MGRSLQSRSGLLEPILFFKPTARHARREDILDGHLIGTDDLSLQSLALYTSNYIISHLLALHGLR